ncbi:type I-E CRISPR-associated protein Cse2/CasB [Micromonospora peucetia]|uniref:CRISPR-associated protein, Cse2 family n=1 Tax=Micromonospora peucetia TaxID=47871 RepID=A0A1C6W5N2_9ACTN|nr:type I-E CRISPR-associated protein Cse2/CasB [Micromonospora peucetia]SCL73674.1 CRISPR-associated protein, Cse2 family [Micromonospora peucetia]
MTVTVPADNDSPTVRHARRRGPFGGYVAAKVAGLQDGYLRESSSAVAVLARLRRAVGREPAADFTILEQTRVTEDHLDQGWLSDDTVTHTEQAMHTVLTLYAVHQQSIRDLPMHQDGIGLGAAVSLLARQSASAEAVHRRFAALGTATTYPSATTHLRSLVRLLRDKRIPLDYGVLAEDLVALQKPWGPAQVRGRWGRDFYRQPDPKDRHEANATDPAPNQTATEE